jgi:hypothetical protein
MLEKARGEPAFTIGAFDDGRNGFLFRGIVGLIASLAGSVEGGHNRSGIEPIFVTVGGAEKFSFGHQNDCSHDAQSSDDRELLPNGEALLSLRHDSILHLNLAFVY